MGHLLQPCRQPGGPLEGAASARWDGADHRAFSDGTSPTRAGTRFASPHYRDWRERLSESARESEDLCPVRSRVCIHYRPAAAGQPMKRPVVSSCITSSFQTLVPQGDRAGQQIGMTGQAGGGWQGRTPRPSGQNFLGAVWARRVCVGPASSLQCGLSRTRADR